MPLINNLDEYLKKLEVLPPFQKSLEDIPNEDYKLDILDINETISMDNNSIQFIGSLNIGPHLFVFNDPSDNTREVDEDEHDIINVNDSKEEVLIVPNYDTNAIIQYGLGVSIKAGLSLESLGFLFSGSAKVRVNTYKQHERTKTLLEASIQDLKVFPWILNINELKNLKNNEACTLEFAGELKSSLEVSWSDLYTGSLLGVSKMLNTAAPLTVDVDAGATIMFDFGIKDDFVLVIKKVSGDKFQVGIKKNKNQSWGAGAKIGVSASIAEKNKGVLEDILNNLLDQYLKKGKDEIDQVLNMANLKVLTQDQLETVKMIMETMRFTKVNVKIDEIKAEWDKYLGLLRDMIQKIATSKIEAGVSFEYSQIKTENCFLMGEFTGAALEKYHIDLIKFNLKDLLKDKNTGVTINKFLEEKGYQRKNGFGFDLKVGKKGLGMDFDSDIEIIKRKNEKEGYLYVSTKSSKSYEGEFLGQKFKWIAGLQVETKDFIYNPTIGDLDFQQHLGFEWNEDKKLEKNEIYKIIDTAVLWGLINGSDRTNSFNLLSDELKSKQAKNINVSLKMDIPEDTFKEIVRTIYEVKKNLNHFNSNLSSALAACMFNRNDSIQERILKHGGNFLRYLSTPSHVMDSELKAYAGYINDSHINQFKNAIDIIINRGGERFSDDTIKKVIRGFNKFHNNIYRVKVMGFMMLLFSRIAGRAGEIESTLKITYTKDNEEKVINMVQNLDPANLNFLE